MIDRNLLKLSGMKGVMAMLVVFALIQASAIAAQAYLLSSSVAALWAGSALESQVATLALFFGCFALQHVVGFAQDTILDRHSETIACRLREELLDRTFDKQIMIAQRVGAARVATSATEGIDEIQSYVRIIPPKIIGIAAISLPLLGFAFATDMISGAILLVMFPVIVFYMVLLGKQARQRAARQYSTYQRLSNRFIDTLRGIDVIESFGAGDVEGKSIWRYSEKLRNATVRMLTTATLSGAILDLCATFGIAAVSIMLAFRLMDGSIALSPALCSLIIAPEYFSPIRSFASDFHASLDGKNALSAVLEMIGTDASHAQQPMGSPEKSESGTASYDIGQSCIPAIQFDSVTFSYSDSDREALSQASFSIDAGEHVAIIGSSGAGKSTLACLASGLLLPREGRISLFGKPITDTGRGFVRFIPQNPYIFRASLLDNVRFYAPDATREEVESACFAVGLEQLISELPQGLETVIGEGARGLSGGQAHRVALARILLDKDARILVFDEPTAHLDIETELELKERMLPIFEDRTVLFATHRLHWLDDMDRVITLENGCIANDELNQRAYCRLARDKESKRYRLFEKPCQNECLGTASGGDMRETANFATSSFPNRTPRSCQGARIPDSCEPKPPISGMGMAREWLSKYRRHVVVAIAFGIAAAGFASLLMFTSGYLISATATVGITLFAILLPVAFVQVFGLGKPVARYLERLVSHDWVFKITSDLRSALFSTIRKRSGDPERAYATGEYLSLLDDDISHLQNLYLRVVFPAAIAYALLVGTAIVFGVVSLPFAGIITCILMVCTIAIPSIAYSIAKPQTLLSKRIKTAEYEQLTDDILGATDWVLAKRCNEVLERHRNSSAQLRSSELNVRLVERCSALAIRLLLGASACLVASWASLRFGRSIGAPNWIAAFVLGFFPLIETFGSIPSAFIASCEHRSALDRLADHVQEAPTYSGDVPPRSRLAHSNNHSTDLKFENLRYQYPLSGRFAIDGVTLTIPAQQKVAILGRSGSGKTTMAKLARGVLAPSGGSVSIGETTVLPRLTDTSGLIGYLAQSPYLFDRSLRDNLTMNINEHTDDELARALVSVGLEDRFKSLPDGLETMVGETGMRFSGGEAHRIALARVLVANTPIILVDEPFSALDPESEKDLLDTLFLAARDRTLVVITHHLADIERFDRVIFFEDGRIDLDDTPSNLMATSPRFRSLIQSDRK